MGDREDKLEEIAEKQMIKAYQKVFLSTEEGHLVFWDLMNRGFVFRPFNQQNAGAYAMEGKREIGLHIMNMVEFQPPMGRPGLNEIEKIRQSLDTAAKYKETAKEDE
jgi:hypothetical protein